MSKDAISIDNDEMFPNSSSRNSNTVMILSSLVMFLGAISGGLMLGFSSPLIPGIENDSQSGIHIGSNEATWIGSLLSLGGIAGGLSAGLVMQAVGRKFTAILSGIPYVGGLLLISFATNVYMIYAGRIITGIGLAFTCLVVPTYVGEIATHSYRGFFGSCNQLSITIGILIIYGIGGLLPWRWLTLVIAIVPVIYIFLCLFIPESPRHLYLKKMHTEAVAALQRLRGKHADISEELGELHDFTFENCEEASWKELITDPAIRKPFFLSMTNMFFQQISGINCVLFYAQTIFQSAGFETASQNRIALVLIAGVQVVFTFVSCLIVDRSGRKILWIISSAIMALSMVAFGLYFQLKTDNLCYTWLALASMMVYISSFAIGLGPLPWLLMVELLPLRAKGKCSGVVTTFNLLLCFIITKEFDDLQKAITTQGTYWFFAGICVVSVLYGIFLLPETRGRSLEEIEAYFQGTNRNGYQEIDSEIDVAER